jgi:predicted nucleic acid-binding protein
MRLFLDANIIVSVLNKEYPLFTYSSRILSLADAKGTEVFTSPVCLAMAFYFAEKKSGTVVAKQKIQLLTERIKVSRIDAEIVSRSISDKKVKDFEDGLEYYSALHTKCDCIITEDVKDFYFADMEVLDSENFCRRYMVRKK